jgi:putative cell wall-binding protein
MRRHRAVLMLGVAVVLAALAAPATAYGVLTNEYGMKYAGREACVFCHSPVLYEGTSHSDFAKPGAHPDDDYMWPAGRPGVGEMLAKEEVAFTLGAGTGMREYLVNNPAAKGGVTPVTYAEVKGSTRYDTAVAASKSAFASAATVVVATGESFPDALGGAGLAGAVNGPLLLTPRASVPASVLDEIRRLGATKIYVLGGPSAVSDAAFAQLDALGDAVRLAGTNRYATAARVAQEVITVLGSAYGGQALMATGVDFPDALAAAPLMYAKDMPLVLVDAKGAFSLPAGVTSVRIVGGNGAVPASVETALGAKFAARIAGTNRYATAAAVAQYASSVGMGWDGVGLATGESFADALSAGPALGVKNDVMLLTSSAKLAADAATALNANKAAIVRCAFFGGPSALSTTTRNQVKAILPGVSVVPDPNPFVVAALEWNAKYPDTWEIGPDGIEWETYTCNGCHHLGFVSMGAKPLAGKFAATASVGARNAWVTDPSSTASSPEKYVAGASIQCENCHGTGEAGPPPVGNHYGDATSNVKILKGTQLLDSQICGQCHAAWKSGNLRGFTPDQNIFTFVTPYGLSDVPTRANWNGGIRSGTTVWRFFPNGANRSAKHSYYTEWAMSGHSFRPQYTGGGIDPRETPYQKEIGGTFDAKTVDVKCLQCHAGEAYAVRKGLAIMGPIPKVRGAFVPTNSNSGFMGIECVNCHIPHGADTDNGMDVRAPESGTSLAGLTNTSICEDCHNWRLEALGLPLVTDPEPVDAQGRPAQDLSAEGGLLYPNRELLNGVGMYEVPDAGKYMPGVKCEECHMPATRSDYPAHTGLGRYEDRSWKRYSHRMHIMEPADAKAWKLPRWGDSCSPCHGGSTVEQLQARLDGWRAAATAASEEASAAYAQAWAIATSGGDENPSTAAFKALMGRAYYNIKSYQNDGSKGVHNPDYIVAGLKAATRMAKSVNGYFDFLTRGGAYPGVSYLVGNVKNGDDTPAAGAEIVFVIDGEPTSVVTDTNGNFSITYASGSSVDDIYWKRCSDPDANLRPEV